jgi:endonuclease/exonuclease/phosphatase family protein
MRLATWNLNHRVGRNRYRPEAADAAIALNADLLAFTEFFPQQHEDEFRTNLFDAGWQHQLMSKETGEIANRVFVASRVPVSPYPLNLPSFDRQFPANVLAALIDPLDLVVVALRVPAYKEGRLLSSAWQWVERTGRGLSQRRAVLLGDFNIAVGVPAPSGQALQRILDEGWQRANCAGPTYFGPAGRTSAIDHILATPQCMLSEGRCVSRVDRYELCGSPSAISDHAAVACVVEVAN